MNENEFELNGKRYVAVSGKGDCLGCAFYDNPLDCYHSPPCAQDKRDDGRDVIFVEKPKPEEEGEGK